MWKDPSSQALQEPLKVLLNNAILPIATLYSSMALYSMRRKAELNCLLQYISSTEILCFVSPSFNCGYWATSHASYLAYLLLVFFMVVFVFLLANCNMTTWILKATQHPIAILATYCYSFARRTYSSMYVFFYFPLRVWSFLNTSFLSLNYNWWLESCPLYRYS